MSGQFADVGADIRPSSVARVMLTTSSGRTALAWTPEAAREVAAALIAAADYLDRTRDVDTREPGA